MSPRTVLQRNNDLSNLHFDNEDYPKTAEVSLDDFNENDDFKPKNSNNFMNLYNIFKFYSLNRHNSDEQVHHQPFNKIPNQHGIWKISINVTKENNVAGIKIHDEKRNMTDIFVLSYKKNKKNSLPTIEDLHRKIDSNNGEIILDTDRYTNDLIIEKIEEKKTHSTVTFKRHVETFDEDDIIMTPGDDSLFFSVIVCKIECAFDWINSNNDHFYKLNDYYHTIDISNDVFNISHEPDIQKIQDKTKNKFLENYTNIQEENIINDFKSPILNFENIMKDTKKIYNKNRKIFIYIGICIALLGVLLILIGLYQRKCKDSRPNFKRQLNELEENSGARFHSKHNKYKLIE